MKKVFCIVGLLAVISCGKEENNNFYSLLSVKFIEDEDYIFIKTIDGNWDQTNKLAWLNATGFKHENFQLYLPNLTDTGNYPTPAITNINYSDGLNFMSFKLNYGFIHISKIDSLSLTGDFQVSLASNFNGYVNRIIVGNFGINYR